MASIGQSGFGGRGLVSSGASVGGTDGLATPSGGFDPDAAAFFAAVEGAGGTIPANVKTEYNEFVLREKANSRYSKLLRLYPFLGGTINGARIDAINLGSAINNNFVDADADATCGLQGNGTTKYLDYGVQAINLYASRDSVQQGVFYIGASAEGVETYPLGAVAGATNNWCVLRKGNTDVTLSYVGSSALSSTAADVTGVSDFSFISARFSSSSLITYIDGVAGTEATGTNSQDLPSLDIYIFCRNLNGGANSFTSAKLGGAFSAETMTSGEVLGFESSYKTFLTNIGVI